MLQAAIVSPGPLPPFSYDPSNPTYWTEWASYSFLQQMYAIGEEGISVKEFETSDFGGFETLWNTYINDAGNWINVALNGYVTEGAIPVPPSPPDIPDQLGAAQGPQTLTSVIVGALVRLLTLWIYGQLKQRVGGGARKEGNLEALKEAIIQA